MGVEGQVETSPARLELRLEGKQRKSGFRSWMNVAFRLPSEELEKRSVAEATGSGLDGLEGHRSVGGSRASIYNAFPEEGVDALVEFMSEFQQRSCSFAACATRCGNCRCVAQSLGAALVGELDQHDVGVLLQPVEDQFRTVRTDVEGPHRVGRGQSGQLTALHRLQIQ